MPAAVNTTTLEIRRSADVTMPPFNAAPWELLVGGRDSYLALRSIPIEYRKQPGGPGTEVLEMSQAEKDAVDAAAEVARKASDGNEIDALDHSFARQMRALIHSYNQRINWLTNRVVELQEDLQAIKTSSGGSQTIRDAIRGSYLGTSTRTLADARQDFKNRINNGEVDT